MKSVIFNCDVCEEEMDEKPSRDIQVIFTTEQTEGRSVKPYLDIIGLDFCNICINHLLEGNYVFGRGAQGHNKYYFKVGKKR